MQEVGSNRNSGNMIVQNLESKIGIQSSNSVGFGTDALGIRT